MDLIGISDVDYIGFSNMDLVGFPDMDYIGFSNVDLIGNSDVDYIGFSNVANKLPIGSILLPVSMFPISLYLSSFVEISRIVYSVQRI